MPIGLQEPTKTFVTSRERMTLSVCMDEGIAGQAHGSAYSCSLEGKKGKAPDGFGRPPQERGSRITRGGCEGPQPGGECLDQESNSEWYHRIPCPGDSLVCKVLRLHGADSPGEDRIKEQVITNVTMIVIMDQVLTAEIGHRGSVDEGRGRT